MTKIILIGFVIMNLVGLVIMKSDKTKAIKHQYRISEKTLWIVAILFGATGMTVGMRAFHHKTKHIQFKFGLPMLSLIEIGVLLYVIKFLS
ncbi:DUF1294 domain-containing protein [Bacillus sp. S/N-304-OC-R1]|uniref:DUF1294 domain-containing protein n=1 Tax=Bacillus sp. S/N-304-OC-R1 TaxID=2758034 RepID=UPI001C8DE9FE|nr:DUF1294 domain-containing protein [Bacillus sp. S/N-304-OC-R1]MBY0124035.1 DUF1294 domain-containing protein [Bacillus sp. S/N-304-OC-R1]